MEETTLSGVLAGYLERRRERRKQNRDAAFLCSRVHDLSDQLLDVNFERQWWQDIAVDAQLESEQLKRQAAELKRQLKQRN